MPKSLMRRASDDDAQTHAASSFQCRAEPDGERTSTLRRTAAIGFFRSAMCRATLAMSAPGLAHFRLLKPAGGDAEIQRMPLGLNGGLGIEWMAFVVAP